MITGSATGSKTSETGSFFSETASALTARSSISSTGSIERGTCTTGSATGFKKSKTRCEAGKETGSSMIAAG